MIQRIQTVYLLLAALACLTCLCLSLGTIVNDDGSIAKVYNLMIIQGDGSRNFIALPLFIILVVTVAICLYTIFIYKNRKMQSRFCSFAELMLAGWCVVCPVILGMNGHEFDVEWTALLPFVAMILCKMAQRGIKHDERLVRAADRIR